MTDVDEGAAAGGELLDADGWPVGSVPAARRPSPTSNDESHDDAEARGGPTRGRADRRAGRGSSRRGGEAQADQAEQDPAERAREICLRLLAFRPRTRAELATALRQRGIDPDVADEVLERYGEVGIIDDAAFARAWVTSRHHGRGLAGRALATELRRKGVDSEAVGAALAEIDRDTEAATARALVERKLRSDRGGPPDAVLRRMIGMLARKGYAPGLAVSVVRDVLADHAADTDALIDSLEAEAAAEAAADTADTAEG